MSTTHTRTHTFVSFANPYLTCDTCGKAAPRWHDPVKCGCDSGAWNDPCRCPAGATSTCPSWSPVDGCRCDKRHINPTDTPFGPPDPTPAVERATRAAAHRAGVGFAALDAATQDLHRDVTRAGLAAALDVDEIARALYDHEYAMGRTWEKAPDWMQAAYTERAVALRAAILGEEPKNESEDER